MSALPSARLPGDWAPAPGLLAGRVVIVTGATGGLGGESARAIQRAGGTVIITGRKVRALEKFYDELVALGGSEPVIHPLDLESATPADYAALAEGVENEFGRLDGIVHAAAHFNELTPIAMHKPDDWLRAMQVNVSAPFALTQACMPLLAKADDSAVVFVLDDPELLSRAHWGGYGVSKAAVERMAAVLHAENGRGAMRVHALLPPPMRTALRRAAYYGENTLDRPLPTASADAVVYLLSGAGAPARGTVLDIRHTH
ncbi:MULTISPECIES: SDR family NAD(P)-dependent oxidoreductase [unclassified Luteibacter]|uniref:SDR family NAD(P)-dependent oxidoreductase n=1 Tax=unclassified Luteibacter TaxID=2620188 RepID=UPI0008AAB06C|nr:MULTISPECIES: SDR family NAD(P)-dependent oxidoreductase [unclassified Luteibacter]MDR6934934.1 NAD(P)-dependent dehydrogenase (short-subunit alcohol dehydrogenase family) [Luteibacter sp. 3190]SEW01277.1 NAD(P)-dependent dehydrogenase, short-chain alcohol dehydrogenase family [Luteibacter sp. 329MFSha]